MMTEHNISLMFGPNLFRANGNEVAELKYLPTKIDLCKIMMLDFESIFVDNTIPEEITVAGS